MKLENSTNREKEEHCEQPTLSDSYERVASNLLGIFLLLFFTTIVATPILLLINKMYPLASNRYAVYLIFALTGYGLWRFFKWTK
jgi:hypothetical protein